MQHDQGKHFSNRQLLSCYNCGKQGHIATFCRKEDESKEDVQNKDQNLSSRQNQNQVLEKKESKIRFSTISPASKRKTLTYG